MRHGKGGKRKRGAHKGARSPETRAWNEQYLVPERPSWMAKDVYRRLVVIRKWVTCFE